MWGAEASLMTKPYIPGEGIAWQWLGGFRYLSYEESATVSGVFNNGGNNVAATTTFGGSTINHMYGPEVGARASLVHRWFTLSATPRVAFALNNYKADTTFQGASAGELKDVDFTPIVQISFTGEIHISPSFSLFGGYDLMYIYRMTRPTDNIRYSSVPIDGGSFAPDIGHQTDPESFYARGLTFGCVLKY